MVLLRTNWMFAWSMNRGWMLAVIATNTIRTAMMPDSRIRNTRSVSLRELVPAGALEGSWRSVNAALIAPASGAGRWPRP